MKTEHIHNGLRYTLTNEGLQTNDKVYPIAWGRCVDKDDWIFHKLSYSPYSSGFPDDPHTIIDLEYSGYKPEQVRTSHGFGAIEQYYKIIKIEKQVIEDHKSRFISYKWIKV